MKPDNSKQIIQFWAKTTLDGQPGISVLNHMLNVGHTAQHLAQTYPQLLQRFQLKAEEIGCLAALHDIGKITPGFQRKCESWLKNNNLSSIEQNGCWDTTMESDHGKVSHSTIQSFLLKNDIAGKTANFLSVVIGGHHGRLGYPNERGYRPTKSVTEQFSTIDWEKERMTNAQLIWQHFGGCRSNLKISKDTPSLWWLAGLTTVADWIGSNDLFFPSYFQKNNQNTSVLAKKALADIGFQQTNFIRNLSFHDLFHDTKHPGKQWIANDMQQKAVSTITDPGVYVIEAPMGVGKTEAALWASYHLLLSKHANGIYFALPTQATSNRIHLRINSFLKRIAPGIGDSRLIHANSWLMDSDSLMLSNNEAREKAGDYGYNWFSSAKRALLAQFGVGTIDQALLGIVAVKHFFVRHYALAGKVVIIDEIHSYDLYTGTLINKLITTLEGLGCTVIILSATLTGKRRHEIIPVSDDNTTEANIPYPLISGKKEMVTFKSVAATPPNHRNIAIEFIDMPIAAQRAVTLAAKGGSVLWICNTVDSAQKQYSQFRQTTSNAFPIGLLHSRFPFWRREELEDEWMERFGKNSSTRCGSILVSTQVVEQSVDLDADLLVTELAPTDMLLQRIGRLWRHDRQKRPVQNACLYIINENASIEEFKNMDAKTIIRTLGNKAYVYDAFILLRTLQLWQKHSTIILPTQIRELIEETYQAQNNEPTAWIKLEDDRFAEDSNKRFLAAMNSNYWQPELMDVEGVQTRLNEIPTVSLVLCNNFSSKEISFSDKSSVHLDASNFELKVAQAIHRNLVKIPEYCFEEGSLKPVPAFSGYLFGKQCIGTIAENGSIAVETLKEKYRLFFTIQLGLIIEKVPSKEEI